VSMRWGRMVSLVAVAAWTATAWWQTHKSLPPGMHTASAVCTVTAQEVSFLADISAADAYGRAVLSQGIFDEVLRVVRGARQFIVLDYQLLLGADATDSSPQRRLAAELTDALLEQRRVHPAIRVLFITDPVNERYGAAPSPQFELLRAAGVTVVRTNLDALRDPNFMYSSLWRLTLHWWGGPPGRLGILARQLNFKSNHRRVIIADDGRGALAAVVGSANPVDQQSAWSNTALRFGGGSVRTLLASELAIARFSGWHGDAAAFGPPANAASACDAVAPAEPTATQARVQVLTEGAIRRELLEQLGAAVNGDFVDFALFKLADRGVIEALLQAARRGVRVRLILDPSEDATTATPSGLPNQPLASELVSRSAGAIRVRWYRTHGERFHSALAMIYGAERLWLLGGSANFTRRSLSDYDLDADLAVGLTRDAPLAQQTLEYFDTLWSNRAALGIEYTADFASFADPSQADYWLCRLLEGAGLVAF
jgi:phosphatidylserine/phosphatidylglycerophosphate/cardiolipin synthase-like enzyme